MNEIFAPVFELFHYSDPFSDDLFAEGLYSSLGLINIFSSLFFVVLFYYFISRPKFSKWYHWLIILFINFIVTYALGVILPQNRFTALGINYNTSEYYVFALKNALIASFIFILFSFTLRWKSPDASGTPIPN